MFEASGGLFGRSAFYAKDYIARRLLLHDFDDSFPIKDSIAAGAAYGGSCNLASFSV